MIINKEKKFEFIRQGCGKPIILLHGLFGELSNFNTVISEFSNKYEIIAPILPIYANNNIFKHNIKSLSVHVNNFVKFLNLKEYIIIGNSLGGHIGLIHTIENQDRVKGVLLTGSSGLYENSFGESYPKRGDKEYISKKVKSTFYDPSIATEELIDKCFAVINNRIKLLKILSISKSAIRHNMSEDLIKIKIPVGLIWGKNDIVTPPHVGEEFHKLLPNSTLYWIDKCGHAPMMEKPKEFNIHLQNWLNKIQF